MRREEEDDEAKARLAGPCGETDATRAGEVKRWLGTLATAAWCRRVGRKGRATAGARAAAVGAACERGLDCG